jgi:hypothetical protein
MLKKALFFVSAVMLLGACTVTEEVSFNKDFSGSGVFSYNLALYGSEEEVDSTLTAQIAMAEEYKMMAKSIPGISNVNYRIDDEESMMFISFDFADLKALNALYKLDAFAEAPFLQKEFVKKGSKKVSVIWPVHNLTDEDRAAFEDEMMDMYTYDLTITFPKNIKSNSVDQPRFEIVTDQQKAYLKGSWGAFYTQTKPVTWKVKM